MGSSLENECLDFVAPEIEHNEDIDRENGDRLCQKYGCFNPDQNMPNYDIGIDLGIARKQLENEQITQWGEINDDDYRQLLRNLNKQQKEFFIPYFALDENKTRSTLCFFDRRCRCGEKCCNKGSLPMFTEIFLSSITELT